MKQIPPQNLLNFDSKVVLVTGSGSGLGRGFAMRFADGGVALVVIYRWYAPQLVERFDLTYPSSDEEEAWHRLQQIPQWPQSIATEAESLRDR